MHVLIVFRVFLTLPRGLRGDQRLPEVGEYPLCSDPQIYQIQVGSQINLKVFKMTSAGH